MTKNRREFLQSLLLAGATAGLLPIVAACGDDSSTGDTGPADSGTGDTGGGDGGGDSGGGDSGGGDSGGGDTGAGDTGTGDGGDASPDSSTSCESVTTTIGTNHGHTFMVPPADVAAGAAMSYDIQGTSPHPHTVDLSADDMTTLQGGGTVMVDSSTDSAHNHAITVMCA